MARTKPSPAYKLVAWAIDNRSRILCTQNGYPREICPIILGHSDGEEKALVWQVGGETSSGPLRRPGWKCFLLTNVADARLGEGAWQAGSRHHNAQSCVKEVDYDANPNSPYHPQHSLGGLVGTSPSDAW
jgi:hypothetical protein